MQHYSFTLGKSAQAEDGSITEPVNNLELTRGTGQRYVVSPSGVFTATDHQYLTNQSRDLHHPVRP